jgi:hypothetical protein
MLRFVAVPGVSSGIVTENLEGLLQVLQNTIFGGSSASDIKPPEGIKEQLEGPVMVLQNTWRVF